LAESVPDMSRKWPVGVLSVLGQKWENYGMEIFERLQQIGIDADTIDAIRADDNKENALLLIALFDDRHEYLD